jgi:hypothetical protein
MKIILEFLDLIQIGREYFFKATLGEDTATSEVSNFEQPHDGRGDYDPKLL